MTFKTYEINVDLVHDTSTTCSNRFSQNDRNSAKLLVTITNKGAELDLSQAKSVRMSFKKPDGTRVFQNDCQPINAMKGKYQIVLKTQTLTSVGNVIAQIHIEEEDRIIDTQKFFFVVNDSLASDEAIESTNEFTIIQKAIEAGKKLEGVDINGIIAAGAKADAALVEVNKNKDQIGILSGNMNVEIAKKTDKSYTDTELSKKRNKTDPLMLADLHTEVKTAMTGGSVPVKGPNDTGTENIKDGAVTVAKVTKRSFKRFVGFGNTFTNTLRPLDTSVFFSGMVPSTVTKVVDANEEFQDYGVRKMINITYPATTSNTYYVRVAPSGSIVTGSTMSIPIGLLGLKVGDTITFGALLQNPLSDGSVYRINLLQNDATGGYLGAKQTGNTSGTTITEVTATTTIMPNCESLGFAIYNPTTTGTEIQLNIAAWYIVKGATNITVHQHKNDRLDGDPTQPPVKYTNRIAGSQVDNEKVLFNNPNPSIYSLSIIKGPEWQSIGYPYVYKASALVSEPAKTRILSQTTKYEDAKKWGSTVENDAQISADFHVDDTVYLKIKYKSNKDFGLTIMSYDANNTYIGSHTDVLMHNLPNSNGSIKEVYTSVKLKNFANQKYLSPVLLNISDVATNIGDYIEFTDLVMSNAPITSNIVHKNSTEVTAAGKFSNKRILYLGDSITNVEMRYVSILNSIIKPASYTNVAVPGAKWRDSDNTVYDGAPTIDKPDNNVLGNQVQKVLNNNYPAPDIIIMAAGTNDLDTISEIELQFTSNGTYKPLNTVDRKTFAGAMRYCVETLLNKYPDAQVFIVTPIQCAEDIRAFTSQKIKRDSIYSIAQRLSIPVFDAFTESGIYGAYETNNTNGKYLIDGLHPNVNGGIKLGSYLAKKLQNGYVEMA